jgi:hypothetical protein
VYLKGAGDDDRIVSEPVAADFMGAFVIAARPGAVYQLFAERLRPAAVQRASVQIRCIHRRRRPEPIRLTLERRY